MMYKLKPDKKYLLFLILPKQRYSNYYGQTELRKSVGVKKVMVPLAITMVAALTPDHYDILIIDEDLDKLPVGIKPDVVGISALSSTAGRAYEIAEHYRTMGSLVVIGGPYVSYMTDEALQHADSVIVGEAEGLWENCLADFEKGEVQKIYRALDYTAFKTSKPPRWDLIKPSRIFMVGVQVSRGCPYKCEFCLVTKLFGQKMRYREIPDVVEELKSLPVRKVLFVDDNLTANKRYARELMQTLPPLRIAWGCMSSIEISKDVSLLNEMVNAGCFNILIGFESLNPESLVETRKNQNKAAQEYEEAIRIIHGAGLHITASFVIGFDNDTVEEFDRMYEFTQRTGLCYINFNILGAPPGSDLYYRLKKEGRMYDIDPELVGGLFPCMHYNKMSQKELFDSYISTIERMYSYDSLLEKAKVLFGSGNFKRPYHDGAPGVIFRARAVYWLLKEFIFTRIRVKRKLMRYIISLIRKKQLATDKGLSFIMSMISYHNHIQLLKAKLPEYHALIAKYDEGPWEKMIGHDNK